MYICFCIIVVICSPLWGIYVYQHNSIRHYMPCWVFSFQTLVALNMRHMSLDDRFFPRPTEFIPERWLRETTGELSKGKQFPFATKPFGFGPRACLGQRFAENEIFIGTTKVVLL